MSDCLRGKHLFCPMCGSGMKNVHPEFPIGDDYTDDVSGPICRRRDMEARCSAGHRVMIRWTSPGTILMDATQSTPWNSSPRRL